MTVDGGTEVHVVWFPERSAFEAYRDDPRRGSIASQPAEVGVDIELLEVRDIRPGGA